MAGTMNQTQIETFKLKAAETTLEQYRVAVLDSTAEQVINPTAQYTGAAAGVLLDATLTAGNYGQFQVSGSALLEVSGAVSIGDKLVISDTSGRVESYVAGTTPSGTEIVGIAKTAGSTSGDIIMAQLTIGSFYAS